MSDSMETNETFQGKRWCRFECIDPTRNASKFWSYTLDKLGRPTVVRFRWGRIGLDCSGTLTRQFPSEAEALIEVTKRVEAKLREGYIKLLPGGPLTLRPDKAGDGTVRGFDPAASFFGVSISDELAALGAALGKAAERGEVIRDPLTRKIIGPKVSPKLKAIQRAMVEDGLRRDAERREKLAKMEAARREAEAAAREVPEFKPIKPAVVTLYEEIRAAQRASLERARVRERAGTDVGRSGVCEHDALRRWRNPDGSIAWACVQCGRVVPLGPAATKEPEQPISLVAGDRKFDFGGK